MAKDEEEDDILPDKDAAKGFYAKYEPKEILGRGISSTVRRCIEKETGKEFAAKIIDLGAATEAGDTNPYHMLEATRQEISILRQVMGHPYIIDLQDVFESDAFVFLVFELCPKGELFDYLTSVVTLSEKKTRTIMRQIFEGVEYIHAKNIVHRDLKPENILLDENHNVKITDFGFARQLKGDEKLTDLCGTPGYLAPETLKCNMFEGSPGYSKEVDIWACGVIMFTLLVGCPPFWHRKQMVMLRNIMEGKYSFTSPEWADISEDPKDLIRKCLVVDPSKRITVKEVLKHPFFNQMLFEQNIDGLKRSLSTKSRRMSRINDIAMVLCSEPSTDGRTTYQLKSQNVRNTTLSNGNRLYYNPSITRAQTTTTTSTTTNNYGYNNHLQQQQQQEQPQSKNSNNYYNNSRKSMTNLYLNQQQQQANLNSNNISNSNNYTPSTNMTTSNSNCTSMEQTTYHSNNYNNNYNYYQSNGNNVYNYSATAGPSIPSTTITATTTTFLATNTTNKNSIANAVTTATSTSIALPEQQQQQQEYEQQVPTIHRYDYTYCKNHENLNNQHQQEHITHTHNYHNTTQSHQNEHQHHHHHLKPYLHYCDCQHSRVQCVEQQPHKNTYTLTGASISSSPSSCNNNTSATNHPSSAEILENASAAPPNDSSHCCVESHQNYYEQLRKQSRFNARKKFQFAILVIRAMIRIRRLRYTAEPLRVEEAIRDPYRVKVLRKVIDGCAFRVYGHWVKKGEGQNRAALFENTPRTELHALYINNLSR